MALFLISEFIYYFGSLVIIILHRNTALPSNLTSSMSSKIKGRDFFKIVLQHHHTFDLECHIAP